MKFNFTKEWCVEQAKLESDCEIGAGRINLSPEDLAPLVEKVAEKLANDINGSGLKEQLEFLKANGWDETTVLKYLTEDEGGEET